MDSWEVEKKGRYYYYMVSNTIAMLFLRCFFFQAQEAKPERRAYVQHMKEALCLLDVHT
jgi:hypothetical protein